MRTLMTVEMDNQAASRSIKDGTMPKVMESTLKQLNVEAAYFTTHDGNRTAYLVFDLQEPAQMPQIAEPLFSELGARIHWSPVMNVKDLQEGLSRLPTQ
jgi:hypothetical protein